MPPMHDVGAATRAGGDSAPVAWVAPGPLRQVTGGYLYDARVVDGLRERGWPVGVIDLRMTGWPLDVAAGRRLGRALGSRRWGAVVADELAHPALAAAVLGGGLRRSSGGAPLILLIHHLRCSEPSPVLTSVVARLVETVAMRAADLVICTSETTAGIVSTMAPDGVPVRMVRPGWDTHGDLTRAGAMHRAPTRSVLVGAQCIAPMGGGATLRLLLIGHWTPRKGILDALAALRQAPAGVTLDLVGEQDRDLAYAARVHAALREPALAGRVRVHGRVSDGELAGLFVAADALILPSTYEGYGMVLAEALAVGLPIVATRVGAVPEVVRDGLEAELVEAGDVAGMARAIERLARDPSDRKRRAALARERAASLPSWRQSIDAFAAILRSLPARRSCESVQRGV